MKKLLTASIAAIAAGSLVAGEVVWEGDGTYSLDTGDRMTISAAATITAESSFSGAGELVLDGASGAAITLDYLMTENPFADFSGTVTLTNGVYVYWSSSSFAENGNLSIFGQAKIVYAGGRIEGFKGSNNQTFPYATEVVAGTFSAITNWWSGGNRGVNLMFKGPIGGGGDLEIYLWDRLIEFSGGASDFTGTLTITGLNGNTLYHQTWWKSSGAMPGALVQKRIGTLYLQPGDGQTVSFGALSVIGDTEAVDIVSSGITVEIGSREGTDSAIAVPFVARSFTLAKVGETTLTLGPAVSAVAGTTVNVNAGTLDLAGANMAGARFNVDAGATLVYNGTVGVLDDAHETIEIREGQTLALAGVQTLTNSVAGAGTLVITNGTITLAFCEYDEGNEFSGFEGNVEFAAGGQLSYLPVSPDGSVHESNHYPIGKGKLIFRGGTLQGFSGVNARNNISIDNDIEVRAGTTSTIVNNSSRSSGSPCNLHFNGGLSGDGELKITQTWHSGRLCYFYANSDFGGVLNLNGNGQYVFSGINSFSPKATCVVTNGADTVIFQNVADATVAFGSFSFDRTNAHLKIASGNVTLRLGGAGTPSLLAAPIETYALAIERVGTEPVTIMATCKQPDGTMATVENANQDAIDLLNSEPGLKGRYKNRTTVVRDGSGAVVSRTYETYLAPPGMKIIVR